MPALLQDLLDHFNTAQQDAQAHTQFSFRQRVLQDSGLVLSVKFENSAIHLKCQLHEGHPYNQSQVLFHEKFKVSSGKFVRTSSTACSESTRLNAERVKFRKSVTPSTIDVALLFGTFTKDDILKAQVTVSNGTAKLRLVECTLKTFQNVELAADNIDVAVPIAVTNTVFLNGFRKTQLRKSVSCQVLGIRSTEVLFEKEVHCNISQLVTILPKSPCKTCTNVVKVCGLITSSRNLNVAIQHDCLHVLSGGGIESLNGELKIAVCNGSILNRGQLLAARLLLYPTETAAAESTRLSAALAWQHKEQGSRLGETLEFFDEEEPPASSVEIWKRFSMAIASSRVCIVDEIIEQHQRVLLRNPPRLAKLHTKAKDLLSGNSEQTGSAQAVVTSLDTLRSLRGKIKAAYVEIYGSGSICNLCQLSGSGHVVVGAGRRIVIERDSALTVTELDILTEAGNIEIAGVIRSNRVSCQVNGGRLAVEASGMIDAINRLSLFAACAEGSPLQNSIELDGRAMSDSVTLSLSETDGVLVGDLKCRQACDVVLGDNSHWYNEGKFAVDGLLAIKLPQQDDYFRCTARNRKFINSSNHLLRAKYVFSQHCSFSNRPGSSVLTTSLSAPAIFNERGATICSRLISAPSDSAGTLIVNLGTLTNQPPAGVECMQGDLQSCRFGFAMVAHEIRNMGTVHVIASQQHRHLRTYFDADHYVSRGSVFSELETDVVLRADSTVGGQFDVPGKVIKIRTIGGTSEFKAKVSASDCNINVGADAMFRCQGDFAQNMALRIEPETISLQQPAASRNGGEFVFESDCSVMRIDTTDVRVVVVQNVTLSSTRISATNLVVDFQGSLITPLIHGHNEPYSTFENSGNITSGENVDLIINVAHTRNFGSISARSLSIAGASFTQQGEHGALKAEEECAVNVQSSSVLNGLVEAVLSRFTVTTATMTLVGTLNSEECVVTLGVNGYFHNSGILNARTRLRIAASGDYRAGHAARNRAFVNTSIHSLRTIELLSAHCKVENQADSTIEATAVLCAPVLVNAGLLKSRSICGTTIHDGDTIHRTSFRNSGIALHCSDDPASLKVDFSDVTNSGFVVCLLLCARTLVSSGYIRATHVRGSYDASSALVNKSSCVNTGLIRIVHDNESQTLDEVNLNMPSLQYDHILNHKDIRGGLLCGRSITNSGCLEVAGIRGDMNPSLALNVQSTLSNLPTGIIKAQGGVNERDILVHTTDNQGILHCSHLCSSVITNSLRINTRMISGQLPEAEAFQETTLRITETGTLGPLIDSGDVDVSVANTQNFGRIFGQKIKIEGVRYIQTGNGSLVAAEACSVYVRSPSVIDGLVEAPLSRFTATTATLTLDGTLKSEECVVTLGVNGYFHNSGILNARTRLRIAASGDYRAGHAAHSRAFVNKSTQPLRTMELLSDHCKVENQADSTIETSSVLCAPVLVNAGHLKSQSIRGNLVHDGATSPRTSFRNSGIAASYSDDQASLHVDFWDVFNTGIITGDELRARSVVNVGHLSMRSLRGHSDPSPKKHPTSTVLTNCASGVIQRTQTIQFTDVLNRGSLESEHLDVHQLTNSGWLFSSRIACSTQPINTVSNTYVIAPRFQREGIDSDNQLTIIADEVSNSGFVVRSLLYTRTLISSGHIQAKAIWGSASLSMALVNDSSVVNTGLIRIVDSDSSHVHEKVKPDVPAVAYAHIFNDKDIKGGLWCGRWVTNRGSIEVIGLRGDLDHDASSSLDNSGDIHITDSNLVQTDPVGVCDFHAVRNDEDAKIRAHFIRCINLSNEGLIFGPKIDIKVDTLFQSREGTCRADLESRIGVLNPNKILIDLGGTLSAPNVTIVCQTGHFKISAALSLSTCVVLVGHDTVFEMCDGATFSDPQCRLEVSPFNNLKDITNSVFRNGTNMGVGEFTCSVILENDNKLKTVLPLKITVLANGSQGRILTPSILAVDKPSVDATTNVVKIGNRGHLEYVPRPGPIKEHAFTIAADLVENYGQIHLQTPDKLPGTLTLQASEFNNGENGVVSCAASNKGLDENKRRQCVLRVDVVKLIQDSSAKMQADDRILLPSLQGCDFEPGLKKKGLFGHIVADTVDITVVGHTNSEFAITATNLKFILCHHSEQGVEFRNSGDIVADFVDIIADSVDSSSNKLCSLSQICDLDAVDDDDDVQLSACVEGMVKYGLEPMQYDEAPVFKNESSGNPNTLQTTALNCKGCTLVNYSAIVCPPDSDRLLISADRFYNTRNGTVGIKEARTGIEEEKPELLGHLDLRICELHNENRIGATSIAVTALLCFNTGEIFATSLCYQGFDGALEASEEEVPNPTQRAAIINASKVQAETGGTIRVSGDIKVAGIHTFRNCATVIAKGNITLTVSTRFDNTGGKLTADGVIQIRSKQFLGKSGVTSNINKVTYGDQREGTVTLSYSDLEDTESLVMLKAEQVEINTEGMKTSSTYTKRQFTLIVGGVARFLDNFCCVKELTVICASLVVEKSLIADTLVVEDRNYRKSTEWKWIGNLVKAAKKAIAGEKKREASEAKLFTVQLPNPDSSLQGQHEVQILSAAETFIQGLGKILETAVVKATCLKIQFELALVECDNLNADQCVEMHIGKPREDFLVKASRPTNDAPSPFTAMVIKSHVFCSSKNISSLFSPEKELIGVTSLIIHEASTLRIYEQDNSLRLQHLQIRGTFGINFRQIVQGEATKSQKPFKSKFLQVTRRLLVDENGKLEVGNINSIRTQNQMVLLGTLTHLPFSSAVLPEREISQYQSPLLSKDLLEINEFSDTDRNRASRVESWCADQSTQYGAGAHRDEVSTPRGREDAELDQDFFPKDAASLDGTSISLEASTIEIANEVNLPNMAVILNAHDESQKDADAGERGDAGLISAVGMVLSARCLEVNATHCIFDRVKVHLIETFVAHCPIGRFELHRTSQLLSLSSLHILARITFVGCESEIMSHGKLDLECEVLVNLGLIEVVPDVGPDSELLDSQIDDSGISSYKTSQATVVPGSLLTKKKKGSVLERGTNWVLNKIGLKPHHQLDKTEKESLDTIVHQGVSRLTIFAKLVVNSGIIDASVPASRVTITANADVQLSTEKIFGICDRNAGFKISTGDEIALPLVSTNIPKMLEDLSRSLQIRKVVSTSLKESEVLARDNTTDHIVLGDAHRAFSEVIDRIIRDGACVEHVTALVDVTSAIATKSRAGYSQIKSVSAPEDIDSRSISIQRVRSTIPTAKKPTFYSRRRNRPAGTNDPMPHPADVLLKARLNSSQPDLALAGSNVNDKKVLAFCDAASVNTNIVNAILDFDSIGDPGSTALRSLVAHNTTLQTLDLSKSRINEADFQIISSGLAENQTMHTFKATAWSEDVPVALTYERATLFPTLAECIPDATQHAGVTYKRVPKVISEFVVSIRCREGDNFKGVNVALPHRAVPDETRPIRAAYGQNRKGKIIKGKISVEDVASGVGHVYVTSPCTWLCFFIVQHRYSVHDKSRRSNPDENLKSHVDETRKSDAWQRYHTRFSRIDGPGGITVSLTKKVTQIESKLALEVVDERKALPYSITPVVELFPHMNFVGFEAIVTLPHSLHFCNDPDPTAIEVICKDKCDRIEIIDYSQILDVSESRITFRTSHFGEWSARLRRVWVSPKSKTKGESSIHEGRLLEDSAAVVAEPITVGADEGAAAAAAPAKLEATDGPAEPAIAEPTAATPGGTAEDLLADSATGNPALDTNAERSVRSIPPEIKLEARYATKLEDWGGVACVVIRSEYNNELNTGCREPPEFPPSKALWEGSVPVQSKVFVKFTCNDKTELYECSAGKCEHETFKVEFPVLEGPVHFVVVVALSNVDADQKRHLGSKVLDWPKKPNFDRRSDFGSKDNAPSSSVARLSTGDNGSLASGPVARLSTSASDGGAALDEVEKESDSVALGSATSKASTSSVGDEGSQDAAEPADDFRGYATRLTPDSSEGGRVIALANHSASGVSLSPHVDDEERTAPVHQPAGQGDPHITDAPVTVVVSCPETASLTGSAPYDLNVFEHCERLRKAKRILVAFDRPRQPELGLRGKHPKDAKVIWSMDAPELAGKSADEKWAAVQKSVKGSVWFHGFRDRIKGSILTIAQARAQGQTIRLVCIKGGPLTRLEQQEMSAISYEVERELDELSIRVRITLEFLPYSKFCEEFPQP